MSELTFSHEELLRAGRFKPEDIAEIRQRRRDNNLLGFAYQLAFVRLVNRLPMQHPLEILDELLNYVAVQLDIPGSAITEYQQRRQTIVEHGGAVVDYLGLRSFGEDEIQALTPFLFDEACRLEQTGPLLIQAKQFLKENGILYPADDTLRRLIVTQRQAARSHIFTRITTDLSSSQRENIDSLLVAGSND